MRPQWHKHWLKALRTLRLWHGREMFGGNEIVDVFGRTTPKHDCREIHIGNFQDGAFGMGWDTVTGILALGAVNGAITGTDTYQIGAMLFLRPLGCYYAGPLKPRRCCPHQSVLRNSRLAGYSTEISHQSSNHKDQRHTNGSANQIGAHFSCQKCPQILKPVPSGESVAQ
ncbi:hypothetical protein K493DRAFT_303335 [Basidiobolus meristosporus CBS 931.73]|uniref:Uncharacterized protein n=1 Tax=Basidiobolus meristosporus CBS 931.73 TaxID=1314790 RepID=A0A1Y1Y358_9FUNG|nr:hypothetical protein K493DRAFT_303335 [Basidiobolus meristosporus CBS 931.73]|eukprot:ORX92433.1 hypothetical protein K493DRAFT_303335 [Basidiobolus meristosporus CBS 931.73]